MTPKLPKTIFNYLNKKSKTLLYIEYICRYNFNLINIVLFIVFAISFVVPYSIARWLHVVYTVKILEVDNLLSVIYTRIYTNKTMRVLYRIVMLTFIVIYISHLIAIVFYAIDKNLIESEYFGNPVDNHKCKLSDI